MQGKAGFEMFTPVKAEIRKVGDKMVRITLPYLNDILFS